MPLNIQQTDNPDVARMAIAYSIASVLVDSSRGGFHSEATVKALTDKYIEVYNAILANEQQQPLTEYRLSFGNEPESQP